MDARERVEAEQRGFGLSVRRAGWRPWTCSPEPGMRMVIGVAGHNRYWIYPTPRNRDRNVYLLSDRARETAVFVESAGGPPTPHQAALILREHGIPSLEMTSEQSRLGKPRVVLGRDGISGGGR